MPIVSLGVGSSFSLGLAVAILLAGFLMVLWEVIQGKSTRLICGLMIYVSLLFSIVISDSLILFIVGSEMMCFFLFVVFFEPKIWTCGLSKLLPSIIADMIILFLAAMVNSSVSEHSLVMNYDFIFLRGSAYKIESTWIEILAVVSMLLKLGMLPFGRPSSEWMMDVGVKRSIAIEIFYLVSAFSVVMSFLGPVFFEKNPSLSLVLILLGMIGLIINIFSLSHKNSKPYAIFLNSISSFSGTIIGVTGVLNEWVSYDSFLVFQVFGLLMIYMMHSNNSKAHSHRTFWSLMVLIVSIICLSNMHKFPSFLGMAVSYSEWVVGYYIMLLCYPLAIFSLCVIYFRYTYISNREILSFNRNEKGVFILSLSCFLAWIFLIGGKF